MTTTEIQELVLQYVLAMCPGHGIPFSTVDGSVLFVHFTKNSGQCPILITGAGIVCVRDMRFAVEDHGFFESLDATMAMLER